MYVFELRLLKLKGVCVCARARLGSNPCESVLFLFYLFSQSTKTKTTYNSGGQRCD